MDNVIKKLSQIKLKDGIKKDKIFFGGSIKTFNIYEIDLDLLAYNHLNERIIIKKSEYEQTEGKSLSDLDVITRNNLIEDWIWNKDTNQNNTTKQSIKSKGQQRYGAVTSDGIIVSGNRRFTALRKLKKEGLDKKFEAIILDSTYKDGGDRTADIKKLEKELQHGEEDRVGYGAIEKYISVCQDMDEMRGSEDQKYKLLKSQRNTTLKEIKKLHKVGLLMIEFLDYFQMNNMYSRLQNTEEGFIRLSSQYDILKSGKGKHEWVSNERDYEDYKYIGFNLIRWIYNAEKENNAKFSQIKDLRKIYFTNSGKYGVFSRKDSWNLFKNEFDYVKLEKINQQPELNLAEIKKKYNIEEDHKALEKKDKLWSDKSAKNVRQALNKTDNKISYTNQDEEAHVYLEDALLKLLHLVEKDSFLLSKRDLTFKRGVIRTLQSKDKNENKENADRIRLIAEAIKREL